MTTKTVLAALGATALAALPANATELTVSSWVAPSHPTISEGYELLFPAIEKASNGDVTFNLVAGGALLGGKETLTGLGDGVADASILALTYNPAQLPVGQVIAELAMLGDDPLAVAAAVTEFNLLHCEPCLAEYAAQNVVYTGTYGTATYALITTAPITTSEDLKGKRIRSPGGAWDRWIETVGGTVVHTSSAEIYEALNKGIVDVAMYPADSLNGFSLWDVAKNTTLASLGVYNAGPLLAFNKDTWAELTPEQRRAILDEMALGIVATTEGYVTRNNAAIKAAPDHGVTIADHPEAIEAEIASYNSADISAVVAKGKDVYGVDKAEEIVSGYVEILDKWKAVTKDGISREDLVERMKTEIFDKLSETEYGL